MPYHSQLPVPLNEYAASERVFNTLRSRGPASLPVPNSSRSFWLHPSAQVNPLAKEGSKGPLTSEADICIIGSGITGVSAAYHISNHILNGGVGPLKIVILEAREFCSGATGRNGGHLHPNAFLDFGRYVKEMGTVEALKQYAIEHHTVNDVVRIIKANKLEDDIDLVDGGRFDLFFTEQEVIDAHLDFKLAEESGADLSGVQWFSKEEMKKAYGTDYAAVKTPGYNLWPLKLVIQLYYLAQSQISRNADASSLYLHTNTPVTSITPSDADSDGERRWNLYTPRGQISCDSILHATNGYASHLIPHLSGPLGIIPTRGQIIATRAAATLSVLTLAAWVGNEGFEYWFPRPLKSDQAPFQDKPLIILGGGREVEPEFEFYESDDSAVNEKVSEVLRKFLPAVLPGKFEDGKEPEMEWTGIMGFTASGDPFVGPVYDEFGVEVQGQYIAAGYTGHGMPRTYACAEAVVSLMLHDLERRPRNSWKAPEWLPERYLTKIRSAAGRNVFISEDSGI